MAFMGSAAAPFLVEEVKMSPLPPAVVPAPPEPVVDSLSLPLPPMDLVFSVNASSTGDASGLRRYIRAGTPTNARSAVVGKGGFGTAYRFERDDSFMPSPDSASGALSRNPSSDGAGDDETMSSPASAAMSLPSWNEDRKAVSQSPSKPLTKLPGARPLIRSFSSPAADDTDLVRNAVRAPVHPRHHSYHQQPPRSSAPAVIIVKVCRTPTSGCFDEMPKTGAGRNAAKLADAALARGDASGFHTRVVRGEARLFRFLQMIARREGRSSSKTGVARMLADLPLSSLPDGSTFVDDNYCAQDEEQTGPVPRLLVYERLVDLDAVLTSKGWARRKREWSVQEVEATSRDIAFGLAFIHANHIVHGDLKPSNVMRDAKTGAAKLIDLGASRRFVCVPNLYKESTTAVEELDQFLAEGSVPPQTPAMVHTDGLGSLTGSPYFMAPEVLLQAVRYIDNQNISRSILHDYVNFPGLLPDGTDIRVFQMAYEDFKRGWGIKSDIWSWAVTVMTLLLKTLPAEKKRSSSTVCPFDFSFDDEADSLAPRHRLHRSERNLPRFHEWARRYPLRIIKITTAEPVLPPEAQGLAAPVLEMVKLSLSHMDTRPTSAAIYQAMTLSSKTSADVAASLMRSDKLQRRISLTPSFQSEDQGTLSHANSTHNVDVRASPAPGQSYASLPRASYSACSVLQPFRGAPQGAGTNESSLVVPDFPKATASPNPAGHAHLLRVFGGDNPPLPSPAAPVNSSGQMFDLIPTEQQLPAEDVVMQGVSHREDVSMAEVEPQSMINEGVNATSGLLLNLPAAVSSQTSLTTVGSEATDDNASVASQARGGESLIEALASTQPPSTMMNAPPILLSTATENRPEDAGIINKTRRKLKSMLPAARKTEEVEYETRNGSTAHLGHQLNQQQQGGEDHSGDNAITPTMPSFASVNATAGETQQYLEQKRDQSSDIGRSLSDLSRSSYSALPAPPPDGRSSPTPSANSIRSANGATRRRIEQDIILAAGPQKLPPSPSSPGFIAKRTSKMSLKVVLKPRKSMQSLSSPKKKGHHEATSPARVSPAYTLPPVPTSPFGADGPTATGIEALRRPSTSTLPVILPSRESTSTKSGGLPSPQHSMMSQASGAGQGREASSEQSRSKWSIGRARGSSISSRQGVAPPSASAVNPANASAVVNDNSSATTAKETMKRRRASTILDKIWPFGGGGSGNGGAVAGLEEIAEAVRQGGDRPPPPSATPATSSSESSVKTKVEKVGGPVTNGKVAMSQMDDRMVK